MEKHEILELNEKDIKKLIAEKYKVEEHNVEIEVYHGDPQWPVERVYATVRL